MLISQKVSASKFPLINMILISNNIVKDRSFLVTFQPSCMGRINKIKVT